jgi:hypothetical protein
MDLRAIIFVPALTGCIIFGFVFALFAAHHYLTVLQSTASGAKHVVWISEPILDSFWKMFYMAWLIGLWLGPAWFLGRAFAAGPDHAWMRYAVPLLVFWICYPVSQLSSLSGPSIWLPLHHEVFGRLARKPGIVVSFLVVSGLDLAALGLGFHWTFNADGLVWLFIGTPLFIVAALLYSRLLGRLAFALVFTRSILTRRKKKSAEVSRSPETPSFESSVASTGIEEDASDRFAQPSDLPPIQTPDDGPLTGYNVAFDEPKSKPRKRVRAQSMRVQSVSADASVASGQAEPDGDFQRPFSMQDDGGAAYGVQEPEVQPEDRAPPEVVKPSEVEMRLLCRDDVPKPPKRLWTPEVFRFVLQPDSLAVIGLLCVICAMVGGLVRVAKAFNPAPDGP